MMFYLTLKTPIALSTYERLGLKIAYYRKINHIEATAFVSETTFLLTTRLKLL